MRRVKADWQAVILVCSKCTRKVGGGFGRKGKSSLAKALRKLGNRKKGRKASFGIVETGCLKICPKDAVVAINGARPRDWTIVRRGTDIHDAAFALGIAPEQMDDTTTFSL